MKKIILFILSLLTFTCYSQKRNCENLPSDYRDKCFDHIKVLSGYGIRTAGSNSELKTIQYLTSKLKEYGLNVIIDTFKYKSFEYDSIAVLFGNERVNAIRLFINPYLREFDIEKVPFFLHTPLNDLKINLQNKIVLVSESYGFFDLFKINAKAIVVVQDSIYRRLKKNSANSKISLQLYGDIEEHESYNVIGKLNSISDNAKDILISGHWDSKLGPGADDNASGISVMLELAKHFRQAESIPFNLTFVAFGAEEVGMQGSQAYLDKYSSEFKNCLLNINLDGVGGNGEIKIETHKSSKENIDVFQNLPSSIRFCSNTDDKHRWILLSPEFYAITLFTKIDSIDWIENTIKKASEDLNIKYKYGLSDGDHRILSLSGIPVIGINVPGNRYHVPDDIPETINKVSLENVGKLVCNIITEVSKTIYLIFDNDVPDTIPQIFAGKILNKDSSYVGYCSFSKTEQCFYYTITNRHWNSSSILRLTPNGKVDTVKFNVNKNWEGEPYITPDGQRMYFTAIKPPSKTPWHADIFYVDKTDTGWGTPVEFPLNSLSSEWHISLTSQKTVYFGSERNTDRLKADLYYSLYENGTYRTAIKLPYPINSEYNDCDPLIAPDESYLIFHSDRPGGYGEHDLYITFNKGDNTWTEPKNMGKSINSNGWEMAPTLSPDGKYLFFTRRKSWNTSEPSKIYWVSTNILDNYR